MIHSPSCLDEENSEKPKTINLFGFLKFVIIYMILGASAIGLSILSFKAYQMLSFALIDAAHMSDNLPFALEDTYGRQLIVGFAVSLVIVMTLNAGFLMFKSFLDLSRFMTRKSS